jgi:hypothetical protein
MNDAVIAYFFQSVRVACDSKCNKAWGVNKRPKVELSEAPDDFAFLADNELGEAPINPGTSEGGVTKPLNPDEFPQKWCVRECERSAMSGPNELDNPPKLPDFSNRKFNIKWRENE